MLAYLLTLLIGKDKNFYNDLVLQKDNHLLERRLSL